MELETGGWWTHGLAPAAREPWPPTRRSARRLPQALTRPRHAAGSKTGPDWDAGTYGVLTRQPWLATARSASLSCPDDELLDLVRLDVTRAAP